MARPKQELTKITTNINTNILEVVDCYARDHGITRTTAITFLLTRALREEDYLKIENSNR